MIYLGMVAWLVCPSKEATDRNIPFVPWHRLTTPTLEFGQVRYVTKETRSRFQAALGRRFGFDTGDILLDVHLERSRRLRTLHSDAGNIDVRAYTWVYRKSSQIMAFVVFGRTAVG